MGFNTALSETCFFFFYFSLPTLMVSYAWHKKDRTINSPISVIDFQLSYIMRKLVFGICEQQRCRSACPSAQSDQHLLFSLPR